MHLQRVAAVIGLLLLAGCGPTGEQAAPTTATTTAAPASASPEPAAQRHPDIVDVEITPAGPTTFDLAVTVSSPYDTPQRYADGWRVVASDGTVLGTHTLMHDHAGEQPFTRTQTGVEIPSSVTEVTVEGRDQQFGFGGESVTVEVPHGAG